MTDDDTDAVSPSRRDPYDADEAKDLAYELTRLVKRRDWRPAGDESNVVTTLCESEGRGDDSYYYFRIDEYFRRGRPKQKKDIVQVPDSVAQFAVDNGLTIFVDPTGRRNTIELR